MKFISDKNIFLINKKLSGSNFDGIIFFISDKDYSYFINPLLASLNLFAEKWLYIHLKVGDFVYKYIDKNNLLEINLDFSYKSIFNKPAFTANIRGPILYQLSKAINSKRIIYTDIDNILVNNINQLFNHKKLYVRRVGINFIDKILGSEKKIMEHKSGVIILNTQEKEYLREDKLIIEFIKKYSEYCYSNLHIWFSDQIYLSKTINQIPNIKKNIFFSKKICDWDFSPFSYFWAAKGYIKNTFIWRLLSKKIILIFILKRKVILKNKKLNNSLFVFIDKSINLIIYPIIFIRYQFLNFIFRLIKYLFRKLFFIKY